MSGFNFEKDLAHQTAAVKSIMAVFKKVEPDSYQKPVTARLSNPIVPFNSDVDFADRVLDIQKMNQIRKTNSISLLKKDSRVLDISMETGTGKTYTYTKAIFELNKAFGMTKFIVVVPTLSIKAGTVSFLRAEATKRHFMESYSDKQLKVHVVESQKGNRSKKAYMPRSIIEFVEAQKHANPALDKTIHVMVINAGMINSDTLSKKFDTRINDAYDNLFDAIASINPITIIDEPHKFKQENATWQNILKFGSQYTLRFGATFDDRYDNLIHELSAVDAFNQDLVKGVVTDIEVFEDGSEEYIKLLSYGAKTTREVIAKSGKNKGKAVNKEFPEAIFEYFDGTKTKPFKLIEGESLSVIHSEMNGIYIEKLNTQKVLLSNGLELKSNQKISPYSYSSTIQDKMIAKAVKRHFEIEKSLLSREVKIKPLTLFFIDDIEGYRGNHEITGDLKTKFETLLKQHIEQLLKSSDLTPFYRSYLESSLKDLSVCHGGYFAQDNSESDEAIEQEVAEILHDKESLLSIDNTRRFIFSKWTLREGWDNPNVFQICKLRSSGSQTSKLQEVGRGLRLPVNEFMSRVKNESFDLYYYVDFSERDFAEQLVNEINEKSGQTPIEELTKLTDEVVQRIVSKYPEQSADTIRNTLGEAGAIDFSGNFKEGGLDIIKAEFPSAFEATGGLKKGKVRVEGKTKSKASIRIGKYTELQELWEVINQRVILEYKIDDESKFQNIFESYLLDNQESFKRRGSITQTQRLTFDQGFASLQEEDDLNNEILPIVSLHYRPFIEELAILLGVNMITLHKAFVAVKDELNINDYLSHQTIRTIKAQFHKYLLDHAFSKFHIGYQQVSNKVHPTVFTDDSGKPYKSIPAHNLGVHFDESKPADQYLFEEVFFDSPLEQENIKKSITGVTVFTKIPKNSIRIPVAGGGTYSPDFAYVIEYDDGQKQLNLIIETKDKEKRALFNDEKQKIKHAQKLFISLKQGFEVRFETQFNNAQIKEILQQAIRETVVD